jgi:uncharacterized alpha/beta hydrolase family protein
MHIFLGIMVIVNIIVLLGCVIQPSNVTKNTNELNELKNRPDIQRKNNE